MGIPFKQIPARLRTPGVFIESTSQLISAGERINTVMICGYMQSSGNAQHNTAYRINNVSDAASLFGNSSMLKAMLSVFLKLNNSLQIYAAAVPAPNAFVNAAGAISIDEDSIQASVFTLRIADEAISINVSDSDTAATIASNLSAAINANADVLVTSEATDNTVELTAEIPGLLGNDIHIETGYYQEELPNIAHTITEMHNGTGAPDLAPLLAVMDEDYYDYVINPFTDAPNLTTLDNVLAQRWKAMTAPNTETIAVMAFRGDLNQTLEKGEGLNSEFFSIMATGESLTTPWVWASTYAAIISDQLTNDPAAPITGDELPFLKGQKNAWCFEDRNKLLFGGISTHLINRDGTVSIEKAITTYQVDAQDNPDWSYLSIHVPELIRNIRRIQRSMLGAKFKGYKIVDDASLYAAGNKVTTVEEIKGYLLTIYRAELLETRAWVANYNDYRDSIVVQRDADNNKRVDYHDEPVMIGQLEIIAGHSTVRHG